MGLARPEECPHRCPELNACINSSVWCDGVTDCPSGHDEALSHCSFLLQLPPLYLCAGTLMILLCTGTLCAFAYKRCRRRPRSVLQTRLKSLSSSDTAIVDEKGVICWHSDNSVRYVEVDRVTTVWRLRRRNVPNWQTTVRNILPNYLLISYTVRQWKCFLPDIGLLNTTYLHKSETANSLLFYWYIYINYQNPINVLSILIEPLCFKRIPLLHTLSFLIERNIEN